MINVGKDRLPRFRKSSESEFSGFGDFQDGKIIPSPFKSEILILKMDVCNSSCPSVNPVNPDSDSE